MVKAWMQNRDDFENENSLVGYLSSQLSRGRLSLVLGAGVSTAFGMPDWPGLLRRLYDEQGIDLPQSYSYARQAEHLREACYRDDHGGFAAAVRTALYRDVDASFEQLRSNGTIAAIGSLVMASCRGSVSEVITFNWDNLLELFLAYHGFVVNSVHSEQHWGGAEDVTVLHPHGYIPVAADEPSSSEIVFDQLSYSSVIGDSARPWRQRLLSIMRTHTCLFIGLSGDDPNLDSLLVACQPEHASLREHTAFWGVRFTDSNDAVEAGFWERRGVFCHAVSDYITALPNFLFLICQEAARKRF